MNARYETFCIPLAARAMTADPPFFGPALDRAGFFSP